MAALLLGGGTRAGLLSDVVLQLLCLPPLLIAVGKLLWPAPAPTPTGSADRTSQGSPRRYLAFLLIFVALCGLVPLIQLVPLPQATWQLLPGRDAIRAAFGHIATPLPAWLPLSVAPHITWQSLLTLMPPLAVFFGVIQLSSADRRRLSVLLLVFALISGFVGLIQLAQGPESRLRFYAITNDTEAVGFFANRNHFSALLYCALVLAGAWVLELTRAFEVRNPAQRFEPGSILPLLAVFLVIVAILAAQTTTRSRAGLGLTIAAVIGGFALALPEWQRGKGVGLSIGIMLGTIGVAGFMALQLSLYRILERFGTDPMADPRVVIARNTIAAAKSFMPFGAGVGTFVPVYARFEGPTDVLSGVYVNRAHNDFLEVWLETGVVGPALFGVFVMWLLVRAVMVWRRQTTGRPIDRALARAGTLVIVLLLAHSLSDYPLRTAGLMAVFAFAAGLLVPPPPGADATEQAIDAAARAAVERGERRAARQVAATEARAKGGVLGAGPAVGTLPPQRSTKGDADWPVATGPIADAPRPASTNQPAWPRAAVETKKSEAWPEAWRVPPANARQPVKPPLPPASLPEATTTEPNSSPAAAVPPPLPPKPPRDG